MTGVFRYSFVALSLAVSSLFGQDATGKITGVITDPAGAMVPNAKVVVTNVGTNIKHETLTNQEGIYQVLQLNIGFGNRIYDELNDVAAFTVDALGAQMGGVLSLWLGITIMFIVEILEFLYCVASQQCRSTNGVDSG